jgi:hypothetical protein
VDTAAAPYAAAIEIVRGSTLGFTNLEVNLLDAEAARGADARPAPRWVQIGRERAAAARDGFDLILLANNHAVDFGPEGCATVKRSATGLRAPVPAWTCASRVRRPSSAQARGGWRWSPSPRRLCRPRERIANRHPGTAGRERVVLRG